MRIITDFYNNAPRHIKRWIMVVIFYLKTLYEKTAADHAWTLASGISFNFILALFPFGLILFTIVGIYLQNSDVIQFIITELSALDFIPENFKEKIVIQLFDRSNELIKNTWITGVIGVAGLFWTMSGLFASMLDVMNRIYDYSGETSFIIGKLRDFMLIIINLVLFIITIFITSLRQIIFYNEFELFGNKFDLSYFDSSIAFTISIIVTFLLHFISYRYVPDFRIPIKALLFSSLIATVLFEISKFGFTFYVLKLSNYSKIYGAYAAVFLIFLFVYVISVVFVIGCEMGNAYLKRNKIELIIKQEKNNGTEKTV